MQVVLQAAETLENAGAVENFPSVADGLWRLIYSSALSAGSGSGGGASSQVLSYIYMNVYIHVCMGTDIYVYIHVYIYIYIYVCIHGGQSLPFLQTPDSGSFSSFGPGSQIGQVYARISSRKQKLENIVEVLLRQPLPFLPQLGKVSLNLGHRMEVRSFVCMCVHVCVV